MKKIFTLVILGVCVIYSNTIFAQTTLAAWTFPGSSADAIIDSSISINSGRFISCEHGVQGVPGFHVIDIDYTTAGASVANIADDKSASAIGFNNGQDSSCWMIKFKSAGYSNLKLYSKQYSSGSPAAGPRDFKIQYRISGTTEWNDLTTVTCGNDWTTGVVNGFNFPEECNNQNVNISVRWIMSSNTDILGATVVETGISKIDDIAIMGTPIPAGVEPLSNKLMHIYPNPNNGNFTIENNAEIKDLKIVNLFGQTVYKSNNTIENKVDINGLPSGIYMLQINYSNNEQLFQKIIVK